MGDAGEFMVGILVGILSFFIGLFLGGVFDDKVIDDIPSVISICDTNEGIKKIEIQLNRNNDLVFCNDGSMFYINGEK